MGRYEELKKELGATVFYGKQLGEKLENPDLSAAERADLESEQEAVLSKAEGLQREAEKQAKSDERELRIKNIGREMDVQDATEEVIVPVYRDAVDAFLKSEGFEQFRAGIKAGVRDLTMDPVIYKAAADITSEQAGDKDTSAFVAGITNLNYTFPLDVGGLFSQATMSGSNISYLKMPAGADADSDYQSIGQQKGGTFVGTLDVAIEYAKTIAATAVIPSQNLDDVAGLEGEIRNILLVGPNGIGQKLEDAYLNGTGGSSEIQGILDLNPDDSTLSGDYVSKSIVKAVADIKSATGFNADAVVVNPDDWFTLVTEVGSVDDRPLNSPWGGGWGVANSALPTIVQSRQIDSGTVLVGAFKAATRYVRQGVSLFADQAGLGLRDKNLVLFVAEVRELVLHRYGKDPFRTVTIAS